VSGVNLDEPRRFATNLTDDKILARCVESPLDLERMNPHNWRGSCHGGATGRLDLGRPGRNAAAVMLRDLGTSLEAAIAQKHGALAPAK
jgi:phytoene dehydrogenase-like protein